MDAANTTSQAEQIKTDIHQTACVKNEISLAYEVQIRSDEESIIAQALDILSRRMRKAEAFFSSPSAVRDFLRLKMSELEFEVFSVIFLEAQHGVIATEEMFRGTLTQSGARRSNPRVLIPQNEKTPLRVS